MQTYLQQDSSVETENLLIHRDKLADRLIYTQRVKEGHGYVGMWINRKKKTNNGSKQNSRNWENNH